MKKLFLLWIVLFSFQAIARADGDKPIKVNRLPDKAQQFIKQYFANNDVAMAKVESSWLEKTYTVIFTNGDKVEFNKNGVWEEVNCKYSSVPAKVIPTAILNYVTANHPGERILKIERDKKNYEVKLSNKWKLTFDPMYQLIDIEQ